MAEEELETPILRPLVWMGDSKKNLQAFPKRAQKVFGDELQLIQFGGMPKNAKPFKGIGGGVFEIAVRHDGDAYRTVLAVFARQKDLCAACLSEEIKERHRDPEE